MNLLILSGQVGRCRKMAAAGQRFIIVHFVYKIITYRKIFFSFKSCKFEKIPYQQVHLQSLAPGTYKKAVKKPSLQPVLTKTVLARNLHIPYVITVLVQTIFTFPFSWMWKHAKTTVILH